MRYSNLIITSIAPKVMVEFGFGRRLHDIGYLKLDFFMYSLNSLKVEDNLTNLKKNINLM